MAILVATPGKVKKLFYAESQNAFEIFLLLFYENLGTKFYQLLKFENFYRKK